MILKGKTLKGKNRVRELGAEWRLVRTEPAVLFSTEPGPWALVEPVAARDPAERSRWINLRSDRDFEILKQRCFCGGAFVGDWTAGNHHDAHRCARVITKFPNR